MKKRVVTDEQRAKLRENLVRARATRAANMERARTERTVEESSALAVRGQQMQDENIEGAARDYGSISTVTRERTAEVQAVIEAMTPERRAKLEMVQARNLARLAETREGLEAIERMEARARQGQTGTTMVPSNPAALMGAFVKSEELNSPQPPTPLLPIVRDVPMKGPFRLTGSQSGMMISELGSCVCGEEKLKWHAICLKVRVRG